MKYYWLFILLFFCFFPLYIAGKRRRKKKKSLMRKRKENTNLEELLKELIGKVCTIKTLDEPVYGVIRQVENHCVVVTDGLGCEKEIVNVEYIVSVSVEKEKKKKVKA